MTKDFIDELIEVVEVKKTIKKSSKKSQLSKGKGQVFLIAGVEIQKNYKHTPEALKKISDANKGKNLSDEAKRKIGDANRGRLVSEVTRKKLSEAGKGKIVVLSEETKRRFL